jgi:hypothetical protein
MARPSTYSQETADTICTRLADGESLRQICQDDEMPGKATVMRWLGEKDKQAFRDQYAHAREAQADHLAEEILQIADDGTNDTYKDDKGDVLTDHDVIARSRLRVDARKWLASKMAPKKYGDKITQEHTGADGGPVVIQATAVDERL